jgi:hypothetical protein
MCECSCPDFQHARNVCKHVRAVRLWMAAFQTWRSPPKRRLATPGVVDDAGIGDELVILTPEGAAYLAEMSDQTATTTLSTYERLYPVCLATGCQDDPEPREQFCYRHQLVDAF